MTPPKNLEFFAGWRVLSPSQAHRIHETCPKLDGLGTHVTNLDVWC